MQHNFVGARLLLAHVLEKGSANAAFMMAQTYDWRILRALRAYGVRGDAAMAREFYQLAAAAGIEEAQERVETLQSDANVDTRVGREKRSRPESHVRGRFASPNGSVGYASALEGGSTADRKLGFGIEEMQTAELG